MLQVLWRQRGVTLIEVLVAVLIFSIGLIGLAGLMIMSTRSNHEGYLRSQVTFLANGMANRMSANPKGIWMGSYNLTYPASAASASCASACDYAGLAAHDAQRWSSQLTTFLPNPMATITCSGVSNVGYNPTAQLNYRPPYGGTCTMLISWTEQVTGDQTTQQKTPTTTQHFAWEFQP